METVTLQLGKPIYKVSNYLQSDWKASWNILLIHSAHINGHLKNQISWKIFNLFYASHSSYSFVLTQRSMFKSIKSFKTIKSLNQLNRTKIIKTIQLKVYFPRKKFIGVSRPFSIKNLCFLLCCKDKAFLSSNGQCFYC